MSDITLMLLGAGASSRFTLPVKKQWLWIGDEPLWLYVLHRFTSFAQFNNIILTAHPQEKPLFEKYSNALVIPGGNTRQESIRNALEQVRSEYVLISDIARVCVQKEVIERILEQKGKADCIAPYVPAVDTVVYKNETIDRSEVKLIQTPQLSRTKTLQEALLQEREFTDESSAIKAFGKDVVYVLGSEKQRKLTYKEDLHYLDCLQPPVNTQRVGMGFDVHAFCKNRPLMLCGVEVPYTKGLAGHSDADVAIHAIIDALMGAAGFGDIGELFPDSNMEYKDIDSKVLLQKTAILLRQCGFTIVQIDLTIMAQAPKLLDFKPAMQQTIASLLELPQHNLNIKATTTEKLGFVGRKEGIAAQAIATLKYFDWRKI
ncbi:2-C-methyl-D-erythritol 4-phosphate cytidylyltransferase / 2-C-methyl-D-erythritol 2,4-cyclodiphosphate synthase [Nitratiruptor sp. YY08-26]|uniref:bifunctional 2-C-methyl-D-erythritol 4-phosphate cytidylyltransferase/2-C-methyl-D-erythritol 2,4-cyclodiphosphate synthase n=1 Tax=unclassified Nitratiruptor TaxID=2624044 RepID=UPI00193595D3|nr:MULTISPECIES: bifunctional 2-C-methyl-D-erythritol 4-phosphate cytidylyltransferase/2-C-methyl-D-erythritol 2,4-cyclodiphosphate synthase [unclassified Nitratiruptor]BCD61834.1 2-C-methyl-D-erythritol 4-phosphate cytidylyltransferase / 2-C-methyl-D-erythritol 2,4-cyclodiphosphate synthase [Nitratiruptor sp. YY08-13]BCD65769.1 2-C-methyl-D-erythritol 4-phosphate cytidylyltransferase / 2-C-methyl-D-erythritol 2,4-cyclodiphosphate synthase [Nitratiruptor sp. YY08-26]